MFTALLKKTKRTNKQNQNTKYQPNTNPLQYKSHIYIEIYNKYQWHRNCLVILYQVSWANLARKGRYNTVMVCGRT